MSAYRDLAGRSRPTKAVKATPCAECGMGCYPAEYHPYTACALYKATRSSAAVRDNLNAVIEFGMRIKPARKRKHVGEDA